MADIVATEKPTLNPNLREFWRKPARNRVLYGGRASSKSWDAAGFVVFLANTYRLRVCCARQFQSKIAESVYTLLKIQIERFGLQDRFDIQERRIINRFTGSEFLFYGLWRSIDEVKGLEGIDILWLEEAHNLLESQWEKLEPTMRKEGSQVWIIFNPNLATDFVYKNFVRNPPPDTVIRKINYDENPFLSNTMQKVIDAHREKDPDEFEHIYLGVPKDDDDDAVIKRTWIMAAIDAHKTLEWAVAGRKRMGFDIADSGNDKCAQVYAHGPVAYWQEEWKAGEDQLLQSSTRVFSKAREFGAHVTYDSIGVGAFAGAKFNELNATLNDTNRVTHEKFNAGAGVWRPDSVYVGKTTNKDHFANLKAQAWWMVADRFRNTYNAIRNGHQYRMDEMIAIDSSMPDIEALIDELSTPKRDFDRLGRVMVESKKDLKEREVPSPNKADAFIMAFAPGNAPLNVSNKLLESM